mmetsp:Transcript_29794/g.64169  ORF Transcript_29794/g.64169 Transcript_29794/m.64169 type:complete len:292 (-) Transcript_29794:1371-2246(-)
MAVYSTFNCNSSSEDNPAAAAAAEEDVDVNAWRVVECPEVADADADAAAAGPAQAESRLFHALCFPSRGWEPAGMPLQEKKSTTATSLNSKPFTWRMPYTSTGAREEAWAVVPTKTSPSAPAPPCPSPSPHPSFWSCSSSTALSRALSVSTHSSQASRRSLGYWRHSRSSAASDTSLSSAGWGPRESPTKSLTLSLLLGKSANRRCSTSFPTCRMPSCDRRDLLSTVTRDSRCCPSDSLCMQLRASSKRKSTPCVMDWAVSPAKNRRSAQQPTLMTSTPISACVRSWISST